MKLQEIVFKVGDMYCSVDSISTQEIVPSESYSLSKTPNSNENMLGMALVRGETYIVLDGGSILGVSEGSRSSTLLFEYESSKIALQVDDVIGIHDFDSTEIQNDVQSLPLIFGKNIVLNVLRLKTKESSSLVLKLDLTQLFDIAERE